METLQRPGDLDGEISEESSGEKLPRCLAEMISKWRPPRLEVCSDVVLISSEVH